MVSYIYLEQIDITIDDNLLEIEGEIIHIKTHCFDENKICID